LVLTMWDFFFQGL